MKLKIKKDDEVKVISGGQKGKEGKVLEIAKNPLRVRVSGVFVQTHTDKKTSQSIQKEGFISYSNVALKQAAPKKTQKRKIEKKKK